MSRCFPFPPPGYEKKPSNDHLDLIVKNLPEKDKEKKHKKKEKKEKEKRESKEKKDKDKHKEKDRGKDKHREKKDRKDKHKGKKRKKDKEKQKILNEKATDGCGAEKITKHGRTADIHGDSSFKEVLVERIKDDANGAVNQMGKETNSDFQRLHGMHIPADKNRNEGSELVHITNASEQKKNFPESAVASGMACAMPQSTEQRRVDGRGFSADNHAKERVETSEKTKERKIDDEKRDRNKDKDLRKSHKWKDEDRDKEKKKEEKRRKEEEHKHIEQERSIGMEQKDRVELHSGASAASVNKKTGAETTLKRKERNGFLHEEEMWPIKLSRPASSPQFQAENGRKSHANHIAAPSASERHKVVNSTVETAPDNKEQGIDDMINIQPLSKPQPPPVPGAVGNGDSLKRPPHPDEKYLSEILRLPRVDESLGFDDQEWLFSTDHSCQTQPKTELEADEVPQPQVWDRGLHIDSADVFALPYVVPY